MAGKTTPPSEEIPLPSLSESALKHHDLAADSEPPTLRPTGNPADDAASVASDASSSTNSSDEFDWNEADDDAQSTVKGKTTKARRGRAAWVGFMKLARPIRTLLVGVIGAGIFITPLLVFVLRFPNNVARHQVFVWSLWLSIIWAASCATYLMVDLLPRIIVKLVNLFGGHVENLKTQIEVSCTRVAVSQPLTPDFSSRSRSLRGSNSSWTSSGPGSRCPSFVAYIIHLGTTGLSSTVSCRCVFLFASA